MIFFAIPLCLASFIALSLAMEKHHGALLGAASAKQPPRLLAWRVAGWAGLTLALGLCVLVQGWGRGVVDVLGAATLATIVLTLWLWPYQPKAILPVAAASIPAAVILFFVFL